MRAYDSYMDEERENIRLAEAGEDDRRAELTGSGAFSRADVAAMDDGQVLNHLTEMAEYERRRQGDHNAD